MSNYYADINVDLPTMLHGAARLHVHLGRMDKANISTRGWTYNDLVNGVVGLSCEPDPAVRQHRCLLCLFDTLDAMTEIGPRAVSYLLDLQRM